MRREGREAAALIPLAVDSFFFFFFHNGPCKSFGCFSAERGVDTLLATRRKTWGLLRGLSRTFTVVYVQSFVHMLSLDIIFRPDPEAATLRLPPNTIAPYKKN